MTKYLRACIHALAVLVVGGLPAEADSHLCDAAARLASERTGVPARILQAITRTETGRGQNDRLEPWPWAVNIGGEGIWSQTRQQALAAAQSAFDQGQRNIDVGCFQLNVRWHLEGFSDIAEMLAPGANALYAAEFLRRLHDEFGTWDAAVGAYHSRTQDFATRYLRRYREILASLDPSQFQDPSEPVAAGSRPPLGGDPPRPTLFVQGAARPLTVMTARPLWEQGQ